MESAIRVLLQPWPTWLYAMAIAPFAGSFLCVLVQRLPEHRDVVLSRSACDHCGTSLGAGELVPLLSYALQRGRCRHCGAAIDRLHPAVELGCMAIALWAATRATDEMLWASCVLGWPLLALALCDARTYVLPDALSLPLLLLGLAVTALLSPPDLTDHALAAALGFSAFRLIAWLYRHVRHRDGLGGGDAKLLAVAGAWLGVTALPFVVLIAALTGLLAAAVMALRAGRFDGGMKLPFGPCLALSIWLVWLYG